MYSINSLKGLLDEYEKEILLWAFETYGTTREIGEILNIDHSTVVRKAQKFGIKKH